MPTIDVGSLRTRSKATPKRWPGANKTCADNKANVESGPKKAPFRLEMRPETRNPPSTVVAPTAVRRRHARTAHIKEGRYVCQAE